jgi:gliding motility-associated-like protein
LTNAVSLDTEVTFAVSGTATEGTDYSNIGTTVTIPANTTTVTIPVTVINDDLVETGGETVIVSLTSTNTAVSVSSTDEATITISDEDASEVSIAATTQAGEPGTNGLLTLSLTNAVSLDTKVTFAISGTATEGTDYSNIGTTVTIPANTTTVTIPVSVINDDLVETGGETVVVSLTSTNTAVTVSATDEATVSISDDDSTEVSIAATDDSAQETTPSANNAVFTVSLSKASTVATIVSYNVTGTASAGDDYTSLSGSITIPAGSMSSTIDILVIDDVLFEDSETVVITLTGITSGDPTTTIGDPASATATIIDNDIDCDAGDDLEICSSDADVTLSSATQNNASSFTWTTNGSGTFTDASILNAVYKPSDDDRTNGEVQLTLSVSGISGADSDAMTLKIWPRVLLNAGVETDMINEGETYQVSGAVAVNHAGILWTSTGGSFDDPTALNPVFIPSTKENVVLRMTATGLGTGACADDYDEISLNINDFPMASNESVTGLEDQELNFSETNFSANYTDAENNAFAGIKIVSIESVGDLEYNGTDVSLGLEISKTDIVNLKFTAQSNENGTNYDSFEFKVFDGIAYSAETYTMQVSITPVNDEPSFTLMNPKDILIDEDMGLIIIDGQVSSQTSGPANESDQVLTLSVSNNNPALFSTQPSIDETGKLRFRSANHAFGTATVSVFISDNAGVENGGDDTSDVQTFTITVEAVNDAPIAEDDLITMDEDTKLSGNVSHDHGNGADSDPDNTYEEFTYTLTDGGTASDNGSLVFNADGTFTFEPKPDFFGDVYFKYQLCDNPVAPLPQKCDEATVAITVTQISDTPLAVNDDLWLKEDSSISGNVFDNDERLVDVPVVIHTNTNPEHGALAINPDGTFTYTPNKGYFGNDSFDYTLRDLDGDESTATVSIVVDPLDYDPIANDDFDTINEEEISTGDLFANDADFINDPVVVISNTDPTNGTVVVNPDGTYTYTPNVDFYGTDTFTYTLEDADGDQDSATVTITVNPVNDVPVAVNDTNITEEDTEVGGNVLLNDTNLGDAPVSVADFTDPANGVAMVLGDGTYTYSPNSNYNGTDTFTYTIEDENGDTSTATVTITVTPINDAPVAIDDTNLTDEKSAVSGNVLTNDTDSDQDKLTVVKINNETVSIGDEIAISNGGTLRLNADGTYEFNPAGDFDYLNTGESTQITFTYSITDGKAESNTATVTITILGVNDAPVAMDDQIDAFDNEQITIHVLDNDEDADGDKLSVDIIEDPKFGKLVVNEDGTVSYIANLGSYCNTDQFKYRICDPAGLCDVATVTIEIGVMDSDEDSIPDAVETLTLNTDGDADLNYLDLDSDNDGISDRDEAGISDPCTDTPVDTDGDGTPDYLDLDSDNDGFSDEEEGDDDCDNDGVADYKDAYDNCGEYLSIPEGFSPNGDGVNDRFIIKGIKDFPNSKLIIFNRWGNKIFEVKGYQNDWDGRADNSMTVGTEVVPEGTYYYIIDLGNGDKPTKGFVYINY